MAKFRAMPRVLYAQNDNLQYTKLSIPQAIAAPAASFVDSSFLHRLCSPVRCGIGWNSLPGPTRAYHPTSTLGCCHVVSFQPTETTMRSWNLPKNPVQILKVPPILWWLKPQFALDPTSHLPIKKHKMRILGRRSTTEPEEISGHKFFARQCTSR